MWHFSVGGLGDENFQANSTMWGGVMGFGIFGAIMYWAREYILYIVKVSVRFAIACLMQVYFRTIESQQPDPQWDAKLDQMSAKLRALKTGAFGEARPSVVPQIG